MPFLGEAKRYTHLLPVHPSAPLLGKIGVGDWLGESIAA